jgi:hypothetical protein
MLFGFSIEQIKVMVGVLLLLAFIGYRIFYYAYWLGHHAGCVAQDHKDIYAIFALKRELSAVFGKEDLKLVDYFISRLVGGIDAKESIEKALEKERIVKGFTD